MIRYSGYKFFSRVYLNITSSRQYTAHVNNWTSHVYDNPLQELVPFLQAPIFANEEAFQPQISSLKEAESLFNKGHHITHHPSAVSFNHLPEHDLSEVAFAGSSNVGKSSLIKALFFNTNEVKIGISKKPGHTRRLHFFDVHEKFSLVDLPGYGQNMPPHYVQSVEPYLRSRPELCRVLLLIDGKVGLTDTDLIGIEMMEEFKRPYALVFTKIDTSSHHETLRILLKFLKQRVSMPCCFPQPFITSVFEGVGLAHLRAFVAHVTGNLSWH